MAKTTLTTPADLRGLFGHQIDTVIIELEISKTDANRRGCYVKSLIGYLARFANGRDTKLLESFTPADIESWLGKFKSPSSRQTWLNRISTLFSFAVRRGYISSNPCDRVERITVPHRAPTILTIEESRKLLSWCPTAFKPYLILAMYAGIRPQEVERLTWKDINLKSKTVRVNLAKVQSHRRIVPLEPIAVKLLSQHPLQTGQICPSSSTLRRWKRRARNLLGFKKWPKDIFRHTAASFLIAHHDNVDKVAKDLGNSRKILLNHYHEPVAKSESKLFWNHRHMTTPLSKPAPR